MSANAFLAGWRRPPNLRPAGDAPRFRILAGVRRWGLALYMLLAVGFPAAAADKVDLVQLRNGDRLTCEIKKLDRSVLSISTDPLGKASVRPSICSRKCGARSADSNDRTSACRELRISCTTNALNVARCVRDGSHQRQPRRAACVGRLRFFDETDHTKHPAARAPC